MNKKDYQKPTMTVIELQNKCQILSGSAVRASRDDYGTANDGVSTQELNSTTGEWEWN